MKVCYPQQGASQHWVLSGPVSESLSGLERESEHMEAAARPLEGTQDMEYSPTCKLPNACWEQNTFLQHPEQLRVVVDNLEEAHCRGDAARS